MKNRLNIKLLSCYAIIRLIRIKVIFTILLAVPLVLIYKYSFDQDLAIKPQQTQFLIKNHVKNVSIIKKVPMYNMQELQRIIESKKCYEPNKTLENLHLFEDILNSPRKPTIDTTIFFHDTSCTRDGRMSFTSRQACAIESAAKWNPNRDIFVLFTAPVGFVPSEPLSPILAALKNYPNIKFRTVDWYEYAKGTPAEEWIKEDRIFLSKFVKPHLSDFVRLLSLYHFGGIHFDLDFVIQKNLNHLICDFVGEERGDWYNNAVIGFRTQNIGHQILEMILKENIKSYNPYCWACAGPDAVTRIVQMICNAMHTIHMTPEKCMGMKVMQRTDFFPLHYGYWRDFFNTTREVVQNVLTLVENSTAVHMWNSMSSGEIIDTTKGNKCAYQIMAERNCPMVLHASGQFF